MTETTATPAAERAPTFENILAEVRRDDSAALSRVLEASRALRVAELDLRDALSGVHQIAGPWARYAELADAAMVEMEVGLTVAAATLKAEHAESREQVRGALRGAIDTVRGRLEELRVRGHLGELDLQDATGERVGAVERAATQAALVLTWAEHDAGRSLAQLRDTAGQAIVDLRRSISELNASILPRSHTE